MRWPVKSIIFVLLTISMGMAGSESRTVHKFFQNNQLPVKITYAFYSLSHGDTVASNIIVKKASASIDGVVAGSVVVIGGSIKIGSSARIMGNVVALGGRIVLMPGARVSGKLVEKKLLKQDEERRRSGLKKFYNESTQFRQDNLYLANFSDDFIVNYNRVDGLTPAIRLIPDYYSDNQIDLTGQIGYSFYRKKMQGHIGIQRWFNDLESSRMFYVGAKIRSESFSGDTWKLNESENTISALVSGFDYYNYAHRKGFSIFGGYSNSFIDFQTGYQSDKIENLEANPELWSVFSVNESMLKQNLSGGYRGINRNLYMTLNVKSGARRFMGSGFAIRAHAESAFSGIKSDYSYDYLRTNARLSWKLNRTEMVVLKGAAGLSRGKLPAYLTYSLGGAGTLEGISANSLTGNKMILMSTEYIFRSDMLPVIDFGNKIYYGIFMKAGDSWTSTHNSQWFDGFSDLTWSSMTKTGGFSIKYVNNKNVFQIDSAWELSSGRNNPIVVIRYISDF